jgi:hypothetical protein
MTTIRSDHPLPPTFIDQGVPPLFMAAVEYHVRASAWGKSSRFGSAHIVLGEQSVAIVYRPRDDPVPLQDLKTTKRNRGEVHKLRAHRTIKSSLFVPKQKEKRVKPPDQTGLRERARSLLPRSLHLPSLQCRLELELPAQIHLGEEIPCLVKVVPLLDSSSSSTVSKVPPFTLSAFSIAVTGKTKVWAAGESRDMDDVKSRADVILDKSKTGMNVALAPSSSSPSSSPTAVVGEGNYARAIIVSPAVQGTAPTFETYNIFRTYAMCVAVEVRCADVAMRMAEEVELVVLPGTGDYYSSTLHGAADQGDFDVLDPARLPSYLEAVSQTAQAVFSILGG